MPSSTVVYTQPSIIDLTEDDKTTTQTTTFLTSTAIGNNIGHVANNTNTVNMCSNATMSTYAGTQANMPYFNLNNPAYGIPASHYGYYNNMQYYYPPPTSQSLVRTSNGYIQAPQNVNETVQKHIQSNWLNDISIINKEVKNSVSEMTVEYVE